MTQLSIKHQTELIQKDLKRTLENEKNIVVLKRLTDK